MLWLTPRAVFFDNVQGHYAYSPPILEVGVEEALKEVLIDPGRFHKRGGKYDW